MKKNRVMSIIANHAAKEAAHRPLASGERMAIDVSYCYPNWVTLFIAVEDFYRLGQQVHGVPALQLKWMAEPMYLPRKGRKESYYKYAARLRTWVNKNVCTFDHNCEDENGNHITGWDCVLAVPSKRGV